MAAFFSRKPPETIDQIGNFGVNQKNKLVLPLSNLLQIYSGQREIVGEEEAHNLNFLKRVGWG